MKIHEYQGKAILARFGVPIPRGDVAFTADEAVNVAQQLGLPVVVKAQIHAGGRGKGGGVKVAKTMDDVQRLASSIIGMNLVTHQTGPEGKVVQRVLVEQGLTIARELYLGLVIDRADAAPGDDGEPGRRDGNREGRRRDAGTHLQGVHPPDRRLRAVPGEEAGVQAGPRRRRRWARP